MDDSYSGCPAWVRPTAWVQEVVASVPTETQRRLHIAKKVKKETYHVMVTGSGFPIPFRLSMILPIFPIPLRKPVADLLELLLESDSSFTDIFFGFAWDVFLALATRVVLLLCVLPPAP